jgi:NADPH-dependent 2,4-dienoyl-CoA reductase/sulfur reductase-like enzyme
MRIYNFEYIILGGGVVAGYAAQEFVRQEIEPDQLAIISAESTLPYERPTLSKKYLTGEKDTDDILINPRAFYDEHGIHLFLNTQIVRADIPNSQLYAENEDLFHFGKLLIATGARPRVLDIPGADLDNVFYLRSDTQARQIRDALADAQNAAVIGGGFIGMEVASVLADQGVAVTMVFPEGRLMEGFFTPEMSRFFRRYYEERGVTILHGTTPAHFEGDERVTQVVLDSDQAIDVDMVVVGIGVEPAVELFQDTGLAINNGIVVNKYMETNRSGIFAAGDVANYNDVIFQQRYRVEHWDNAVKQGQHAVRIMTVSPRKNRDQFMQVRYFFSDVFDLSYEFWGDTRYANQVVYRGSLEHASFSVWWLTHNRIDAVFVLNRPDEERDLASEWITMRRRVNPVELQNPAISLNEMTPYFA